MNRRRKPSFHGGRWQVQRERARIDSPTPPEEFRDAESLEEVLPRLLERLGASITPWLEELERDWTAIVGTDVAKHTRPGKLLDKKLIVFVDHPIWLQELSRTSRPLMLRRLQERFGTTRIRDIILRMDPGSRP